MSASPDTKVIAGSRGRTPVPAVHRPVGLLASQLFITPLVVRTYTLRRSYTLTFVLIEKRTHTGRELLAEKKIIHDPYICNDWHYVWLIILWLSCCCTVWVCVCLYLLWLGLRWPLPLSCETIYCSTANSHPQPQPLVTGNQIQFRSLNYLLEREYKALILCLCPSRNTLQILPIISSLVRL